jgi:pSer/pThr/pTyr-binding forkhead associated (FHA) protein
VITCPKCNKENQERNRFCLSCGAVLPRGTAKQAAPEPPPPAALVPPAPPPPAPPPPPLAHEPAHAAPVAAPAPAPATAAAFAAAPAAAPAAPHIVDEVTITGAGDAANGLASNSLTCPQCGHVNGAGNKFCAGCGFKLSKPAAVPAPAPVAQGGLMLTALRADGTEAGSFPLPGGQGTVGRNTGSIFAGDSYLSPQHASFSLRAGRLFVRDESSLNGVYRKLAPEAPTPLHPGSVFRIGQEIVRFEAIQAPPPAPDGAERLGSPAKGYIGRIALLIGRDVTGNAYPVPAAGLHLGRERGDVLFPEDGYVSGLHCRIYLEDSQVYLTDLGSSNGSFVRIEGETELTSGEILLMGQQLFRVNVV